MTRTITTNVRKAASDAAYLTYVNDAGNTLATRDLTNAITDAVINALLETTDTICAWCPTSARGQAWHNDGRLHPSCGQPDHGQGWVPEWRPLPDREQIADALRSNILGASTLAHNVRLEMADAVLKLLTN